MLIGIEIVLKSLKNFDVKYFFNPIEPSYNQKFTKKIISNKIRIQNHKKQIKRLT